MLLSSIRSLFTPERSLGTGAGLSTRVLIEMVGGVRNKDGRGGTVGRMVAATVDASAPGACHGEAIEIMMTRRFTQLLLGGVNMEFLE